MQTALITFNSVSPSLSLFNSSKLNLTLSPPLSLTSLTERVFVSVP